VRQQADEKISELQDADEQHLRQLTGWLERVDGYIREIEQRLTRSSTRLEAVQQVHIGRIVEIERREMEQLNSLFAAVRDITERTQAALIEINGGE
jgi:hypothetical protein